MTCTVNCIGYICSEGVRRNPYRTVPWNKCSHLTLDIYSTCMQYTRYHRFSCVLELGIFTNLGKSVMYVKLNECQLQYDIILLNLSPFYFPWVDKVSMLIHNNTNPWRRLTITVPSHDNWCTATLWNRIMTAQCEGMGEVGSARYEPALLPPCPSIRVLSYSNCQEIHSRQQTGLAV